MILDGSHLEKFDEEGFLVPPDTETMALEAFTGSNGKLMVPQPTWVKDFPGQVTNTREWGPRVGRRVIRYSPVDELPSKIAEKVKELYGK